jgi:sulfotransferase
MKQFVALSGLPRSGSTLLSAILDQNPDIHIPGNSPVCQLMWDLQVSAINSEQIKATSRENKIIPLVKSIPETFYSDAKDKIIIDKCRSWTLPANIDLLCKITERPKIIVMVRPIDEIVKSFINLFNKNNKIGNHETMLLTEQSEPIMRSYEGVRYVLSGKSKAECLYINYKTLVTKPQNVINDVYKFLNLPFFKHTFNNLNYKHAENDNIYGLPGMHTIHKTLKFKKYNVKLTETTQLKCNQLNEHIKLVLV